MRNSDNGAILILRSMSKSNKFSSRNNELRALLNVCQAIKLSKYLKVWSRRKRRNLYNYTRKRSRPIKTWNQVVSIKWKSLFCKREREPSYVRVSNYVVKKKCAAAAASCLLRVASKQCRMTSTSTIRSSFKNMWIC